MKLVKNPTKKLNKKQTGILFDEVKESERADQGMFQQNDRMRDLLAGKHYPSESQTSSQPRMVVNLVHAILRTLLPTIYFREPYVNAYPRHPLANGKEESWGRVLNAILHRNNFKDEMKKVVFDALLQREGWVKIVQSLPPDSGGATTETKRGPDVWEGRVLPMALRVAPNNVIVDRLAPERDPEQARFIAIRHTKPFDELKLDDRYTIPDDFDRRSLISARDAKAQFRRHNEEDTKGDMQGRRTSQSETAKNLIVFYETYVYQYIVLDQKVQLYKRVIVLAEGASTPLRDIEWKEIVGPEFPGWPLERVIFNPVPDSYPMADAEAWDQLQQSLNWVTSKIVDFVSHQNMRIALDVEKVENADEAVRQLMKGRSFEVIKVRDTDKGPAWVTDSAQAVNRDMYQLTGQLIQFIDRVSQVGSNKQGADGNFRTATEASIAQQNSGIRDSERVDIVSDFFASVVTKFASLIAQFADRAYIFRIAGDLGNVQWERFEPDDLRWMPDIEIEVDSFRESEVTAEAAKYMQVLTMAGNLYPIIGPSLNMPELLRTTMEKMKIPNVNEILSDTNGAREYQYMEIMMMLAGQQVPPSPEDAHQEHIVAIEYMMASPVWNILPPEARQMVVQHYEGHQQIIQQMNEQQQQGGGQPSNLGQNPMDQPPGALNPANEARTATAFEREATSAPDGGAGQFA